MATPASPTSDRPRIAVCDDYERTMLDDPGWDAIRARADVTVFEQAWPDRAAVIDALQPFDAVCLMRERTPFPAEVIQALPRLKHIVFTGARNLGVDHRAAAARGITVSSTAGGPTKASTAELTWALLLAAAKRLVAADTGMREGHWRGDATGRPYGLPDVLAGTRLGIIGLGQIGERVARIGQAFDMEVVAWSQNLTDERAAAVGVKRVDKATLLATSQVVSLHLLLSERTRGILGADDLAAMRPDAVLVNTARAALVDQAALLHALRAGRPGMAALDVYEQEPLPAGSPWTTLPNVVLAPHLGYVNAATFDVFRPGVIAALQGWLDGAPVRLVTD